LRSARRRLVVCVVFTLAAYALEQLLATCLAAHDPLAAAISGSVGRVLATAIAVLGLRLFLFFAAPCWWALCIARAASIAWTARAERTDGVGAEDGKV
jgi:hypothetical protein